MQSPGFFYFSCAVAFLVCIVESLSVFMFYCTVILFRLVFEVLYVSYFGPLWQALILIRFLIAVTNSFCVLCSS